VAALNRHQVRYVSHQVRYIVIGAFAAIAQQPPIPAIRDIDISSETSQDNLARLSQALTELGARIRTETVPDGLPFRHDATSLAAADGWRMICPDSEFGISFHPSAFLGGHSQLAASSRRVRVSDVEVVADLADVIRSKESAGRPKDLRVLPVHYRHLSGSEQNSGNESHAPVKTAPIRSCCSR
jgi:hypothetical protein